LGLDSDAGSEVGYDTTTGIRGMYATKPFKKGEIVCKIPSDLALSLTDPNSDAATSETAMNVADGAVNFLQWYANNEQARQMWSSYLDTLPTKEANFDVSRLHIMFCESLITNTLTVTSIYSPHQISTQMKR